MTSEKQKDNDVYSHNGREGLVDDDEMTPEEEAFMEGYDIDDEEDQDIEAEGDKAYQKAFET